MAQRAVALNYMFCMGAAYVIGALIYGSRVPECFFPGKFDHFVSRTCHFREGETDATNNSLFSVFLKYD